MKKDGNSGWQPVKNLSAAGSAYLKAERELMAAVKKGVGREKLVSLRYKVKYCSQQLAKEK